MRSRVAVALEGTVDNIGAVIVHVWHNWLIHAAVPRYVSWLSESVSVYILVSHVENWVLSCSPFTMSIRNRRILRKNSSYVPIKQIWVIS